MKGLKGRKKGRKRGEGERESVGEEDKRTRKKANDT